MHGHEAGGIETGALVLAVALIVLGVILFFQKTAPLAVSAVLVVGGLVLGAGAFTFLRSEADAHAPGPASAPYQDVVFALCEAHDAQPNEARALFADRVHGPLHELADRVAEQDRDAAARLLEAKQQVEFVLDDPLAGPEVVRRDLDRLIDSTVAALAVIEVEVDGCV